MFGKKGKRWVRKMKLRKYSKATLLGYNKHTFLFFFKERLCLSANNTYEANRGKIFGRAKRASNRDKKDEA